MPSSRCDLVLTPRHLTGSYHLILNLWFSPVSLPPRHSVSRPFNWPQLSNSQSQSLLGLCHSLCHPTGHYAALPSYTQSLVPLRLSPSSPWLFLSGSRLRLRLRWNINKVNRRNRVNFVCSTLIGSILRSPMSAKRAARINPTKNTKKHGTAPSIWKPANRPTIPKMY